MDVASDPRPDTCADDALRLLVRRAATDPRAMTDLISCCRPYVARLCRRHTRNRADADDLEQDVWLALIKGVAQIHEPGAVYGWLRQVAVRAAIAGSKKTSREVPSGADLASSGTSPTADTTPESVLRDEQRRVVRSAMGRLQPTDRKLLTLLSAEDRPDYAEISRTLGRPIGSIGPTRQRVLVRLRQDRAMVALAD